MGEPMDRWAPRRWARAAKGALSDLRRTAAATERQVEIARRAKRSTEQLSKSMAATARTTQQQLDVVASTLRAQHQLLEQLRADAAKIEAEVRTIRVAGTASTMRAVHDFAATRVLTYRETLESLARDELSFARFGDGELRLMVDPLYRLGFQGNSVALREALRSTLQRQDDSLLVGWPRAFWTPHNTTVWSIVWDDVQPLVPPTGRFGNSHVSRPDCFEELGEEAVELWRQVWQGRHVTIVTGEGSRFDLVPQLFDNLAGHDVVHSTPRNAFADLERLEREILDRRSSDLHLVSLGPAGTVLAARLAAAGVRAIDIGHISNSYLYVFEGETYPESLPGVRRARTSAGRA
ncbi:GT-D fold domain-containing glycosyltransferase [Isoptericola sp. 4D.3]|uniref:GT-D fold domain-containing glycosyltransferase n=1 Tax=Isoptericola peretonis TaxID=2918523 RepID=A0ABT0J695_9MICO|nr:GT-D fold domain-containing glycosyltransferase [Isoptericola sp. 4D.3]